MSAGDKLNSLTGGSLSMSGLFLLLFYLYTFSSLLTLQVLCIHMTAPSLGVPWDSWVYDTWPLHLCPFHVPALGLFPFSCVLFQSISFGLCCYCVSFLALIPQQKDLTQWAVQQSAHLECSPFSSAWLLELNMLIPWAGSFHSHRLLSRYTPAHFTDKCTNTKPECLSYPRP